MTETPSKLLYSATMSLDGFIAGVDGDMSWLSAAWPLVRPDARAAAAWPRPSVTFLDDLAAAAEAAKAAAAGKYVNVLGANVAKQCLEAGLLDEVLVLVAPVLLGDGTRLFEHRGGTNIRLERLPRQRGLTSLWFRVVK